MFVFESRAFSYTGRFNVVCAVLQKAMNWDASEQPPEVHWHLWRTCAQVLNAVDSNELKQGKKKKRFFIKKSIPMVSIKSLEFFLVELFELHDLLEDVFKNVFACAILRVELACDAKNFAAFPDVVLQIVVVALVCELC